MMPTDRFIAIAPMMAYTDCHFRVLMRLLSRHVWLYTEMIPSTELVRNRRYRLLHYNSVERPLALQLGGSDPAELAICARMAADLGYDEINLNIGCPSARVNTGKFGACLLQHPELVAECVAAMQHVVDIPVTIKTRVGVDECDDYSNLQRFITLNAQAGCRTFIVHARKAWLHGLNPKQNRTLPPLQYAKVYRLKQDFPGLEIIINGGINTVMDVRAHLAHVDGVMIGRAAYHDPWLIARLEQIYYAEYGETANSIREVLRQYLPHVAKQLTQGVKLHHITRHLLGFFRGRPGARYWRRYLAEESRKHHSNITVLTTVIERLGGEA